ncbi:hypothetical protein KO465_00785 [Candidatus Micrarchaeota archaeon]|nr:hypothetical protein [Candidatus Micrarchaeota archaeon]
MDKGATIKRLDKGPLDRLTNHNLLITQFGKEGLLIYSSIDNTKSVNQILDETGISENVFSEVLDFMIEHNMIDIVGSSPAEDLDSRISSRSSDYDIESEEKELEAEIQTPPSPPHSKQTVRTPLYEEEDADISLISPEYASDPTIDSEEKELDKFVNEDEEIKPVLAPSRTISPKPPSSPPPSKPKDSPKQDIPPPLPSRTISPKPPSSPPPSKPKDSPKQDIPPPVRPQTDSKPFEIKPSVETEEKEDSFAKTLTPIEKKVYDRFGETGVKVYSLIDGEKTAEEILKETKISDVKLIEILEYLDTERIIKLEKPEQRKKLAELRPMAEQKATLLSETKPSEQATEIIGSDIVPVDIPVKNALPIMKKVVFLPKLLSAEGGKIKKVYDLIDGQKGLVDLCLQANMSLPNMDKYMEFLSKEGAILFRTMSREDISKKYGEEGLSIYKKYGREGVLIYELIGNVSSFKEIVTKSGINPERAVDIFIFIHKVLNLELPLTKETMFKQLGIL